MYELVADAADRSTNGFDFLIGLIVIGLAVAAVMIGRSPKARKSVGRATGRAAIGTARATGRPIRALGRRSRSGVIGRWGRAVVGCEDRSTAAAESGDHRKARFWRGMGDALVGSSRMSCHVPGCTWSQDPPNMPDVVAHLRSHRNDKQATDTDKPSATTTGDQPAAEPNTTGDTMTITAAESIPALAAQLDSTLIPQATREADASASALVRAEQQALGLTASLETMASLGMPPATLATLTAASEAATSARAAAGAYATQCANVRDQLVAARAAIRGQEAVADVAAAAGGAMHQSAYNQ